MFIERNGKIFHSGPVYYKSVPDTLYFCNGDGTFRDVSLSPALANTQVQQWGLIAADLTGDGHPDVYTCNDGKANFSSLMTAKATLPKKR